MIPLPPERHDVLLAGIAPKHIRRWLRQVGGVTPWSENRYRLVLAEKVMLYCGARWHDWDDSASLHDMGGLEFSGTRKSVSVARDPSGRTVKIDSDVPAQVAVSQNRPIRVVEEMRWIPRYADIQGWLFQVWYPSSYYTKEHYDRHVTGRSDLPLLGEFPAHGQYERQFVHDEIGLDGQPKVSETFPTIPGESWMERAIQHNERSIAERANNADLDTTARAWRGLNVMREMQAARSSYQESRRRERDAQIADDISPLFGSSLEAGRIREEIAARCRMKGIVMGHVGA